MSKWIYETWNSYSQKHVCFNVLSLEASFDHSIIFAIFIRTFSTSNRSSSHLISFHSNTYSIEKNGIQILFTWKLWEFFILLQPRSFWYPLMALCLIGIIRFNDLFSTKNPGNSVFVIYSYAKILKLCFQ